MHGRGGRGSSAGGRQDLVAQVVRPRAEGAGDGDDRGGLRREADAEAAPPRKAAERPQGGPLGPLAAGEAGARRALAQVCTQLRALRARERAVELLRDRDLGVGARERALELLAQRATGSEEQRLDGGRRHAENLGDLRVRASFDLAQDDGGALVEREMPERAADVLGGRPAVVLDDLVGDVVVELHFLRPSRRRAEALQADVVRDLDQPVERRVWLLPPLERAERVEERRLHDVLRVRTVAEHPVRVAIDVRRVTPVQPVEGVVQARRSRHAHQDARFRENLRLATQGLWLEASGSGCGWPGRGRPGRLP